MLHEIGTKFSDDARRLNYIWKLIIDSQTEQPGTEKWHPIDSAYQVKFEEFYNADPNTQIHFQMNGKDYKIDFATMTGRIDQAPKETIRLQKVERKNKLTN